LATQPPGLLLQDEAEILSDSAVQIQRLHKIPFLGSIFTPAQALGLIDRPTVVVQKPSALR
jgi:hypothetical protein